MTSLNTKQPCFVLVETTHSGNIGAAARAMKTMGFSKLRLVRPCKYMTAEALARASGADDIVKNAEVFDSLEDAIADCVSVYGTSARSRSMEWSVSDVPEVAERMNNDTASSAVVFGRERSGLTNEELACCNGRLWIPSNPDFSSLNLASAVQVVTYELRRSTGFEYPGDSPGETPEMPPQSQVDSLAATADDDPPADHAAMQHFFNHLESVMITTGFLDPDNPRLLMQRLRRLFSRSQVLHSEIQILRGFLTAVDKSVVEKNGPQSL